MKRQKKFFTVRKKLIAAASSLGVAMIMVVSSTYAWFTLSTAPEVTGISTQIGANGNLEMALLPASGKTDEIKTGIIGTNATATTTNTYWGNLVDLSDASYGLNEISLKPARLNVTGSKVNGYNGEGSMLKTPTYSEDGRVSGLTANTTSAVKANGEFKTADTTQYGVRAIGTANGKSTQEIAYLNAKGAIASNKAAAKSQAQTAISTQGNAIADIAVKHALDENATFTESNVTEIKAFATALKTAFDYVDAALRQAVVAKATTIPEAAAFTTAKNAIESAAKLSELSVDGVTLPTDIQGYAQAVEADMDKLQAIVDATFTATGEGGAYKWSDLSTHFGTLIDTTKITINGMNVSDAKNNLGSLMKGVTVATPTSSGVMANLADFVGDYSASVTVHDLSYNGTNIGDVDAILKAQTAETTVKLDVAANSLAGTTPAGQTGATNLTDLYGYALDFAFRTNAASSNLLLQIADAQRIYSDSTNTLTQGGGTYFEFTSVDPTMLANDAKNLVNVMAALRVVFTDGEGNILAIGATSRTVTEGVTSFVKGTDYTVNGSTVKARLALYNYTVEADGQLTLGNKLESAKLLALTANEATKLSVITYLDGDNVDNGMISAFDKITGNLNLQFASDAELVPMDNSDLKG